jgi:hypothetical protein
MQIGIEKETKKILLEKQQQRQEEREARREMERFAM